MSTEQQAAAQSTTTQLTDADKKRVVELQEQLIELQRQANASNPAGKSYDTGQLQTTMKDTQTGKQYAAWLQSTASARARIPAIESEYQTMIANPTLKSYAQNHPATASEIRYYAISQTGFDPDIQSSRKDIDVARVNMIKDLARSNPSLSINEISQMYKERSGKLLPENVETDYSGTLKAREMGFNVLSGLSTNLPETFAKDFEKRFAERNKFIGLTENITTEKANIITDTITKVTPQRQRVQAQTGQPDSMFANPTFIKQKKSIDALGVDTTNTSTHYTIGLTEGSTGPKPKAFAVSLFEGSPATPRDLTQEQVNALSPSEFALYKTEYDVFNRYQKDKYLKERKQFFGEYKEDRQKIKEFLGEAKKEGATRIKITDEQGNLLVSSPIERAYYDIRKQGNKLVYLTPAGTPEQLLTGYTQDEKGKITSSYTKGERFANGNFIPDKPTTPPTPQPKDALSNAIKTLSQMSKHSTNPFIAATSGFFAETVSTFGGLVNLSGLSAEAFVRYKTGDPNRIISKPEIELAPTEPSRLTDAIISSSQKAYKYKNLKAFAEVGEGLGNYSQALQNDTAKTLGETAGFLFPFSPTSFLKAIPISTEKAAVAGISKTATSLVAGYGSKTRPFLSFTSEGKVMLGAPKFQGEIVAEAVTQKQLKRGIKLAADSSALSQKVFSDIETIQKIKGVTPETLERARNVKAIIEIGSKSKDPVRRGFGEQPFESIKPEETKSLLESFKGQQKRITGKLGGIEGSTSQIPFVLDPYVRMSGDFDFHLKTFETAANRARQTAREIMPAPDREFRPAIGKTTKTAHVELFEGGKNKGKVGEFLNEEQIDEATGELEAITGNTLFGKAIPEGTKKIEGLKTFSLQRQLVKKGESIFSLQKGEGDELLMEPFAPRKPKDVSDFYAIAETKAVNLLLAGKEKEALELGREISKFKKNFAEIDIHEYFKTAEADKTIFGEGESIIDKITPTAEDIQTGLIAGSKAPEAIPEPESRPIESIRTSNVFGSESRTFLKPMDRSERGISRYSRSMRRSQAAQTKPNSLISSSSSSRNVSSPASVFGKSPSSIGKSPSSLESISGKSYSSLTGKSPNSLTGKSPSSLSPSSLTSLESLDSTTRNPPRTFGQLPIFTTESDKTKDNKKDWSNFLGSTSEIQIEGMFNRNIIYGKTKPIKQERKDTAFIQKKRGFTKLVTQRQGSILTEKKKGILFREDKKEVSRQKRKTGGFF